MDETLHQALAGWGDFYLITGTAAATLTGLQFVVTTLLASGPRAMGSDDPESGIAAFGTPTVVHFGLALLVSAALCAPWPAYGGIRAALGTLGAGALLYSAVVLRRALRQRTYKPELEDWVWHMLLPPAAYAAILAAALLLHRGAVGALFTLGAATLLLLCIGIHNAWDTVTYLTLNVLRTPAPGAAPAVPRRTDAASSRRRRRR